MTDDNDAMTFSVLRISSKEFGVIASDHSHEWNEDGIGMKHP